MKAAAALFLPLLLLGGPSQPPGQVQGGLEARRIPGRPWDLTEEQERAVARGLKWLADRQDPAGFWRGDVGFKLQSDYELFEEAAPHVGVSALALMAFLAHGDLPGRGTYGSQVERGLRFVLACQRADGSIEAHGTRMYSHAFASLFLAEIYGETGDDRVYKALQAATRFIIDSQNNEGGWRYRPKADVSDMSVTVCQVMALRAARNVGIQVPWSVIQRAVGYVRRSAVTERDTRFFGSREFGIAPGGFKYQLNDPSGGPQRASYALTAAGVTTLLGAGLYDDPLVTAGLQYMSNFARAVNRRPDHYFFSYGHYYSSQAHFIVGGEWWRHYFQETREILLRIQLQDGSWPNRVGPGPAFGTAVATLILQVPYQYLPIYQR